MDVGHKNRKENKRKRSEDNGSSTFRTPFDQYIDETGVFISTFRGEKNNPFLSWTWMKTKGAASGIPLLT